MTTDRPTSETPSISNATQCTVSAHRLRGNGTVTVTNRANSEILNYRSTDDEASRCVDKRVFPDVSKGTVSHLRRLLQAEHPSTVTDYTETACTREGGNSTAYYFFL